MNYEKLIEDNFRTCTVRYLGADVCEFKYCYRGQNISCRVIGFEFADVPSGAILTEEQREVEAVKMAVDIGVRFIRTLELDNKLAAVLGGVAAEFMTYQTTLELQSLEASNKVQLLYVI